MKLLLISGGLLKIEWYFSNVRVSSMVLDCIWDWKNYRKNI